MPVTWSDENSSYYISPAGDRTHDLPHTVASNMGKVSHAITHSATAAVVRNVHGLVDQEVHQNNPENDVILAYSDGIAQTSTSIENYKNV